MVSDDFVIIDDSSSSSFSSSCSTQSVKSSSSSYSTESAKSSSSSSTRSIESSSSSSSSTRSIESSLSSSSTKPVIGKTTSNKRKAMVTINGYQFQMKNFNKAKTMKFWRCANRSCGVLLHTSLNDEFVRFSGNVVEHSHLPNPAQLEIRELREAMRRRAKNELIPLQEIAEQEVRKGLLTGEAFAVLPNILNLGHNLLHNRRQMMPPIPDTCFLSIPEIYTRDYLGRDRLLLYDSHHPKFHLDSSSHVPSQGRMLVWSSDTQLKLLFDSKKLYMDGTFSTAPSNFDQVYIIQAIHHGTCIPVVYALLPDRKAPTYIHLFQLLFAEARKIGKTIDPMLIMTDFEPAVTKAITLEFSETTIQKGCFFHLCKAIYRQVQHLGLSSTYLNDVMMRSVIRQMMALALMPKGHVSSLFLALQEELSEADRGELTGLFKYFNDQ